MITSDTANSWGACRPEGIRRLLLSFVKAGIAHGAVKKLLQKVWFYGGDYNPVDIEYFGVKFRLQPWDNVVDRKIVFGSKRRDRDEIGFLEGHLDQHSIFLDIGANIGYYSCMLAASGVNRVIAVEPHPVTRDRLTFNIEANNFQNSITIAPYALGDSAGEVTLTTQGGDLGSSSVFNINSNARVTHYKVEMMSLQGLCDKLKVSRIDAAKIDIEGLEDKVLIPFFEEAPSSLWPHYLIIEHVHSTDWGNDLFEKIDQCGYRARLQTRANTIYQLQHV
jgi:FkbM family methyltransferase